MANKKNNKKKPVKKTKTTSIREVKIVEEKEELEEEIEEEREEEVDLEEESANNKMIMGITIGILAAFVVVVLIFSSIKGKTNLNYTTTEKMGKTIYEIGDTQYVESEEETDLVKIDIKDYGIMIAELYPDIAPITVKNFKKLVGEKYYDGLIFHRVIKDFMIQTGEPTGTGSGGSNEMIKGEFSNNGVDNDLSHKRGVLSMARRGGNPDTEETMNSASSQFFIVQKDSDYLDGNYAGFGYVINGIELADKIVNVSTDSNDKPVKDVVMNSIRFVKVYEAETLDGEDKLKEGENN